MYVGAFMVFILIWKICGAVKLLLVLERREHAYRGRKLCRLWPQKWQTVANQLLASPKSILLAVCLSTGLVPRTVTETRKRVTNSTIRCFIQKGKKYWKIMWHQLLTSTLALQPLLYHYASHYRVKFLQMERETEVPGTDWWYTSLCIYTSSRGNQSRKSHEYQLDKCQYIFHYLSRKIYENTSKCESHNMYSVGETGVKSEWYINLLISLYFLLSALVVVTIDPHVGTIVTTRFHKHTYKLYVEDNF
jgi:hypothetical protein